MNIMLQCPKCGSTNFKDMKSTDDGVYYVCEQCGEESMIEHMPAEVKGSGPVSTSKAYVTFKIDARFTATVDTHPDMSREEIIKKATEEYENADFGPLSDIDGDVIIIEDDDGNWVYEK